MLERDSVAHGLGRHYVTSCVVACKLCSYLILPRLLFKILETRVLSGSNFIVEIGGFCWFGFVWKMLSHSLKFFHFVVGHRVELRHGML